MTAPLALTRRQVTALCEGAKAAGFSPVVQIGNVLVRLVPDDKAKVPLPNEPLDHDEDIRL